jgi:hypothetical protein
MYTYIHMCQGDLTVCGSRCAPTTPQESSSRALEVQRNILEQSARPMIHPDEEVHEAPPRKPLPGNSKCKSDREGSRSMNTPDYQSYPVRYCLFVFQGKNTPFGTSRMAAKSTAQARVRLTVRRTDLGEHCYVKPVLPTAEAAIKTNKATTKHNTNQKNMTMQTSGITKKNNGTCETMRSQKTTPTMNKTNIQHRKQTSQHNQHINT